MRPHLSMQCSIPLCHDAYGNFHVFGLAKKRVFLKWRAEDVVAVEAALRHKTSPLWSRRSVSRECAKTMQT